VDTQEVEKIRAVVADNHSLTLSGVADSLSTHGITVVGQGNTAAEAIELVTATKPDVLITDLDFGPGPTGLDVASRLRDAYPKLGIVILSAYGDPRLHHVSMDHIPAGLVYLIKQKVSSTLEIVDAATLAIKNADKATKGTLPQINLTASQIAVLRLLVQGMSNAAIGANLSISEESVAKTINRMAKRLDITSGPDVNIRGALIQSYFDLVGSN
jgi:DNA-binding NarL/FixJ family response regulator